MIVVTGGCGMVGSRLVHRLNRLGRSDILVADNLTDGRKAKNVATACFEDYVDKEDCLAALAGRMAEVEIVFHLGACSRTTEADGRYVMKNNYEFSRALLALCQEGGVPLVYASSAGVYGNGGVFREEPECERPLSVYALSKRLFDVRVRQVTASSLRAPVTGLRFFNVYGPGEHHKDDMCSPVFRFFSQIRQGRAAEVFEPPAGGAEPRRDFVHVDDVVSVLVWAWRSQVAGIFNVGTGEAWSFDAVARAVVERLAQGEVRRVPFPGRLLPSYQSTTRASLERLRAAGCDERFRPMPEGVADYVAWLEREAPLLHGPVESW
ncbi:ADP-glyceromanno-heptose 6-epimerase [Prosthecomicrobium pneumaticum]|uniref:ADP-L-glycero-D-manno-heptose 6-epimerase n=1 Tax=Prosthecomicrobium pneumaticum TaxID=81895 RepID=A0A7W9CTY0_9HYPH|nr:ADP-glyceromanno-heptose 6-epimerase [Prosthecomicrobium pneumaticum]MBB5751594.1 ADP-L-glycero-D-manno-heptose 6-epimerase [Prosthecomicrobium pneumaticum]